MKQKIKRVVIKIGSSSITSSGELNTKVIDSITYQVSLLYKLGIEIVIVSSGSVACGRKKLNLVNRKRFGQVSAIYGQSILMHAWIKSFKKYSVHVGQVLISESDLKKPNTPIVKGLKYGIQIINANDAINDEEMKSFYLSSDNDKLSGHIAEFIKADMLILLTNVEGVLDEDGRIIRIYNKKSKIKLGDKSSLGTGGMLSKVNVGLNITKKGVKAIIANANSKDVIIKCLTEKTIGTTFED